MRKVIAVLILLSSGAFYATAETRDPAAAGAYWMQGANVCINARKNSELSANEKIQVCDEIGAMMDRKFNEPEYKPLNAYEANFFWYSRAALFTAKQGIYSDLDKDRSLRVCEMLRKSFEAQSNIVNDAWPQNYRDLHTRTVQTYAGPYQKCRTEFGWPNG